MLTVFSATTLKQRWQSEQSGQSGKLSNASTAVNCESQRVGPFFPHPQGSRLFLGVRAQEETGAAVFYSQVESVCWGLGLNQKQQAALRGPSQGKTFLDDDFRC